MGVDAVVTKGISALCFARTEGSNSMARDDSLSVTVLYRQRKTALDKAALKETVDRAVAALEAERGAFGAVSLVLVSDRKIRELNRDYAGNNRATDVLSFPLHEGGEGPEGPHRELGDIVVSVETAARQVGEKQRSGHPQTETLPEEIALLFVHGVLHLLGHDHADAGEAQEMLGYEQRIMALVRGPGNGPLNLRSGC